MCVWVTSFVWYSGNKLSRLFFFVVDVFFFFVEGFHMALSGQFSREGLDGDAPEPFVKVIEGSVAVLFPPAKGSEGDGAAASAAKRVPDANVFYDGSGEGDSEEGQSIFYNPAQVVNRDLSICAIEAFSRLRPQEAPRKGGTKDGITILEALSATGLRALRYWKEITGVKYIIANDLDTDAVGCIRRNAEYNGVPLTAPTLHENIAKDADGAAQRGVIPNHDDAIVLMQRLALSPQFFKGQRVAQIPDAASGSCEPKPLLQQEYVDVVDLDPYGTASPFLDAAFSCIKEGGLMLVTSTDSPILCGNYPDTCHAKYNSIMMKPAACHEVAVRILLAAAERAANKYKKYIVPLISLHIDFYVRVFFRVYTQAAEAKLATAKLAHVAQCTRCPSFWLSPIGRVRSTRKEINRERELKKQKRNRDSNDAENASSDAAAGASTPAGAYQHVPTAAYPQVPNRQEPFKVSCPTADSWLPSDNRNHCPVCGGHIAIGGPIYAAPTQNVEFLDALLKVVEERHSEGRLTATERVRGLIMAAREELPEAPLFYALPDVASFVRCRLPQTPLFVGALSRLGYRFSQVHCHRSGIKTNCPPDLLIRAMLAYSKIAPADPSLPDGAETEDGGKTSTGCSSALLPSVTALEGLDFSYDRQYDFRSSATGVSKFIPNAPGWGPKRRHQGVAHTTDDE